MSNKLTEYIKQRGLTATIVAQELGVSRQAICEYCNKKTPTAKTLKKIAEAMTNLGAPTTVVDLVQILYPKQ